MPTPRYLRFAQSLALCSGIAMIPGCPGPTELADAGNADAPLPGLDAPGTDAPVTDAPVTDAPGADAPGTDAPIVESDAGTSDDVGTPEDAGMAELDGGDCTTCDCFSVLDAGLPSCDSVGLISCCVAVGPLAPPDLPA